MSDAAQPRAASRFGAIILAAGSSSRLGQPKQLLCFEGKPLVTRAAEAALAAGADPVVIVLGAHAEEIRHALRELPVQLVENPAWAGGMGTSAHAGMIALEKRAPAVDAVLLAVCDQPHFSAQAIGQLAAALDNHKTIAATRHENGAGVPAIFARIHFPELRALSGATGARKLISTHASRVATVTLPGLDVDIDTPEDWARLRA